MADKGILEGIKVLTLEQVHAMPWGTGSWPTWGLRSFALKASTTCRTENPGPLPTASLEKNGGTRVVAWSITAPATSKAFAWM